jgi:hypothetical protein
MWRMSGGMAAIGTVAAEAAKGAEHAALRYADQCRDAPIS